jgi:hypothetical protein
MPAGAHNIEVEQGATFELSVVYKTDVDGLAVDLTGYSGRGQIRVTTATATTLASFSVTLTETAEFDADDNPFWRVDVVLAADALEGVSLDGPRWNNKLAASYDVELYTAADAHVIRLLNGFAYISPEVTR